MKDGVGIVARVGGVAQALPVLILSIPAGHIADRYDRRLVVRVGLVLPAGCSLALASVVVRHTLIQPLPPDELRGRVAAVNTVFIGASKKLGGFESGVTAAAFGLTRSIVIGGVGTILFTLGVGALWPQERRLGSLRDIRPMKSTGPLPAGFEVMTMSKPE